MISTAGDNASLAGGTISGDLTITGDLKVEGGGSFTYDQIIEGKLHVDQGGTYSTSGKIFSIGADGLSDVTMHLGGGNQFYITSGTSNIQIDRSSHIYFDTNGSERIRITSAGLVGIGETAPDEMLHLKSSTDAKPVIKLENSGNNVNSPQIVMLNSSTANDDDKSGTIRFKGMNDAGTPEEIEYGTIYVHNQDVSDGTEDSDMYFRTMSNGTLDSRLTLSSSNATFSGNGTFSEGLILPTTKILYFDGGDNTFIRENGGDTLQIYTGGAARLILDTNSRISLSNNDNGANNTVFGKNTGVDLGSGGNQNALFGEEAGTNITTSDDNVAIGFQAMHGNDSTATTGVGRNVAIGSSSMYAITTGVQNIGIGSSALASITTGQNNIAIGHNTGDAISTGSDNVALGYNALSA